MAQAKEGDKVKVNYTGSLEDGTVFGSSPEEDPLEFTIGQRNVLPSFENAVIGMNEGDTKTVSIPPEEAFGHPKEDLIFNVERTKLPPSIDLKLGGVLRVGSDAGQDFDVIIAAIDDEVVTLDGNHPLAGKVLNLEIQLIQIL
ncbi:MAG: FKBP-type peptidyl-prolyl cis-trans isomerase [Deltaproteobacteria bacterium]|nr:MAG: FKBP-type peptidyl-prolyl cis-trans isomerase [Deltaproteobacteria bacterium]